MKLPSKEKVLEFIMKRSYDTTSDEIIPYMKYKQSLVEIENKFGFYDYAYKQNCHIIDQLPHVSEQGKESLKIGFRRKMVKMLDDDIAEGKSGG